MKANPPISLDAQIAEILGWTDILYSPEGDRWVGIPPESAAYTWVECYNTHRLGTWKLVERFNLLVIHDRDKWICAKLKNALDFIDGGYLDIDANVVDGHLLNMGIADTAPKAIRLAVANKVPIA